MKEVTDPVVEPIGGWVTGVELYSQPLITVTLCRFTAAPFEEQEQFCTRRGVSHPDVDCWEQFHSASALLHGDVEAFPLAVNAVRHGDDGPTVEAI